MDPSLGGGTELPPMFLTRSQHGEASGLAQLIIKWGSFPSIAQLEGEVFDQPEFRLKYNPYLPTVPN